MRGLDYESAFVVASPRPTKAQKGSRKIKVTSKYGTGQCAVPHALPSVEFSHLLSCFGKIPFEFGCAASVAAAITDRQAEGIGSMNVELAATKEADVARRVDQVEKYQAQSQEKERGLQRNVSQLQERRIKEIFLVSQVVKDE